MNWVMNLDVETVLSQHMKRWYSRWIETRRIHEIVSYFVFDQITWVTLESKRDDHGFWCRNTMRRVALCRILICFSHLVLNSIFTPCVSSSWKFWGDFWRVFGSFNGWYLCLRDRPMMAILDSRLFFIRFLFFYFCFDVVCLWIRNLRKNKVVEEIMSRFVIDWPSNQ